MLSGDPLKFKPGQYVDITIPGGEEHPLVLNGQICLRDELEFMIKIYPDGKFSGLLSDGGLKEGDEVEVNGPYGVFTLREKSERPLLFIGGGAGMAPILALLRALAEIGQRARGGLLLRRARSAGPVSPGGAQRARGAPAEFPVRAGAVGLR